MSLTIKEAAKKLGISEASCYRRTAQLGIKKRRRRKTYLDESAIKRLAELIKKPKTQTQIASDNREAIQELIDQGVPYIDIAHTYDIRVQVITPKLFKKRKRKPQKKAAKGSKAVVNRRQTLWKLAVAVVNPTDNKFHYYGRL